jgi:hypothetical protein
VKNFPDLLAAWAVTLWVGGLWAIGYLAAPTLFYDQPDKVLAGLLAGKMFLYIGWTGVVCGSWLILFRLTRFGGRALKQGFFWIALIMLLLTLAQIFGIQPIMQQLKDQAGAQDVMNSLFKERFATWHGVASAVYLIESLLGLALVTKR